ncbi:MAG: hypothetical protein MK212_21675, partial [Saprospiraceae bacterium]|nr:hypothetical protein [Saprospiraceae bacterium]
RRIISRAAMIDGSGYNIPPNYKAKTRPCIQLLVNALEYVEIAQFFFKPEEVKMRARIASFQDQLFDKYRPDKIDRQIAIRLIWAYVAYINKYPEDQFAAIYCYQGARLAGQINEHIASIEFLDLIYNQYTDFEQYAESMFLLAAQYENQLTTYLEGRDPSQYVETKVNSKISIRYLENIEPLKEAEKLYKEFLQKYPKHVLVPHAEAGLKYLGKKPNEVITNFLTIQKDSLQ